MGQSEQYMHSGSTWLLYAMQIRMVNYQAGRVTAEFPSSGLGNSLLRHNIAKQWNSLRSFYSPQVEDMQK